MQAIILAGGFGSRLQNVVKHVPKPMAEIDSRPFLFYLVSKLHKHKFKKIIFSVYYLKEKIIDYFGNNFFGIEIDYAIEDEPLGTGGAILNCFKYLDLDKSVFILNGDSFSNVDLEKMLEFHLLKKSDFTISLKFIQKPFRYGLVEFNNDGLVVNFKEKSYEIDEGHINSGIYILNPKILKKFQLPNKFSFENDFLCKFFNKILLNAFESNDYFIDIGIPEDYIRAQKEIPLITKNKALFLDRDGVINYDYGHVGKIDDFKFIDGIFKICKYAQDNGFILIIITNQAGIAKGFYTENDFKKLTIWMENEFLKNDVKISKVYYCPFHKDSIFSEYKKDSFDRKPNPGMILNAINEFNINPSKSIFIGDRDTDEEASKRANVSRFIKVKNIQYDNDFLKEFEIIIGK